MKLLIEELSPSESHIITETTEDDKHTYLTGVFMQGGIKNRNGREYPLNEITRAVKTAQAQIQETNGIFGELDHPQQLTINMDRVSHVITEISMDGNNAVGRAKLLNTPMGNIAKELFNSGVRVGVSSRGAGSVNEGMVSDFNFVTVDIVATPSAPGAMPNAVYESLDSTIKGRQVITLAEQMQNDPEAQKYFKDAILKFINQGLLAKK